jgi:hypothetical protein
MTRDQINAVVTALGDLTTVLKEADPMDKAEIYQQLGLTLTYQPANKLVTAQAKPDPIMYVGTCPRTDRYRNPTITTSRAGDRHRSTVRLASSRSRRSSSRSRSSWTGIDR